MGMIYGHNPSLVIGTIPAAGTLSEEFRLETAAIVGLIAGPIGTVGSGFVTGTLTFQVSAYSEYDDVDTASYVTVNDTANANVAFTVSGSLALKGTDLEFLAPYRYIKFNMSTTQTNGVQITLVTKG